MSERRAGERITEVVGSWPVTDDDVDDVIALMRLNYERVVERHGLPAVSSRGR
jgi:hypothetical protein